MKEREGRETFDKKFEESAVREVLEAFEARRSERRLLERGWELNMNFLAGNQYCGINPAGELEEEQPRFYWQYRRVFNHIAPAFDTRCAKLARVRPSLTVRAATGEESDIRCAKIATNALRSVCEECGFDETISRATVWSETCGTAFYKVLWDARGGRQLVGGGEAGREGAVRIAAVPPFEIYPENLACERVEQQPSIIHAKAVPVEDIYAAYGVKLAGRDIDEFALSPYSAAAHAAARPVTAKAVRHGYEVLIERYERPTPDMPRGRLTIAAGDELLFDGDLPYADGPDGRPGYPFVRQTCLPLAGSFFGASVVDRLIPVQRAYNAVKNRKHEFLNRISMGTIAVEDGSVDTDDLLADGLAPGKILIYRQGGTPPAMLALGSVPSEFSEEEDRLAEEFGKISGVGEIAQSANTFNSVTSATGLQLLIEQDEARLNVSYEQIRSALKCIGRHILCLYRQFSPGLRVMRAAGGGEGGGMFGFGAADIAVDDVVLESDSEINLTPAQRRTVIYDMIAAGLLSGEDGKLSAGVKNRVLAYLGYNAFADGRDATPLHRARCAEENAELARGEEPNIRPICWARAFRTITRGRLNATSPNIKNF